MSSAVASSAHQEATESILSRIDFADAYRSLGVEFVTDSPSASGWLACWAAGRPHGDSPNAGVNVRTGRYHDFGGSGDNLSLFDFAATYSPRFSDWKAAREHFAAVAGVPLPSGRPPTRPDEHLEFIPWTEESLAILRLWCLVNKPGILPDAVLRAGGRLARYRDQYTVIAVPIWGPQLLDADPVGWVVWNSQLLGKASLLPVFHKDKSITWVKMKTTAGSKPGLIGVAGLQNLSQADTVVKCEGPGDAFALDGVMPGFEQCRSVVLTNANGSGEIPPRWVIDLFAGKRVLTVHDADEPGQIGATRWAEAAARTATESKAVQLPYPIEKKDGKDVRDWIRDDGGSWHGLLKLSESAPVVSPPPPGAPKADDDPMRLARVFLEKYQHHAESGMHTLAHWRDDWYRWVGTHWQRTSKDDISARVYAAVEQELDAIAIEEEKLAKDGPPIKAVKVTQKLMGDVLAGLKALTLLSDRVQPNSSRDDAGRWVKREWMSVKNGVLRIGDLLNDDLIGDAADPDADYLTPHSPLWFSTNCLPYEFNPDAKSEFWQAVIEKNMEGDQERIAILQEWTGYMLTPDTRYQKFLLMEGSGANGKSVYCGVLKALLGADNVSHVPLELFGGEFQLASTLGKLANITPECGEIDKVAEGQLKAFSSGDSMQFGRKYQSAIESSPTARLVVSTNILPRFMDRTSGVWRRMIYVPFSYTVPKDEIIPGLDRDDQWTTTWADQMPGVLNWAIEGLKRLRRNERFTESAVCERAKAEYRAESNPAGTFLADYVEKSEFGTAVASSKLYEVYRVWCTETGHKPLSNNVFAKEVLRAYPNAVSKRFSESGIRRWCYEGIKLREDPSGF